MMKQTGPWQLFGLALLAEIVLCFIGDSRVIFGQQSTKATGGFSQQEQPDRSSDQSSKTNGQSELTDGLLELLNDQPANAPKSSQPPKSKSVPVDQGTIDGSPLLKIRESMQRATNSLRQTTNDRVALEAQDEVIQKLDQLIAQIEKQEQSKQNSNKQSQSSVRQGSQQQQTSSQPNGEESTSGKQSSSTPGDRGQTADVDVRTKDQAAMQKSVWGHLPGRVRTQMESRMVEEFLPSYREQIEAYYRALLEQGSQK